jgi:hypothetical protein
LHTNMADSANLAMSVAGIQETASMRHNARDRAWPLLCTKWLQNFTMKTPMKFRLWCNLSFEPNTENNLCNKNQLDALFIFNLFHHPTSTCFGHMLPIIRSYTLYMYSNWYVLYFEADWLLAGSGWNFPSAASQPKRIIRTNCCTYRAYSVYVLMMGNTCPKYVEVKWRNKLSINIASSCFHYRDYQDARSAKC